MWVCVCTCVICVLFVSCKVVWDLNLNCLGSVSGIVGDLCDPVHVWVLLETLCVHECLRGNLGETAVLCLTVLGFCIRQFECLGSV